jgi:hypothetical protein
VDGNVDLFDYEWGQVSIVQMPSRYVQCDHSKKSCETKDFEGHDKKFSLPVKTLKTIMKELGHDRVDILKLDVEGSEYAFLEDAIDTSALDHVQQVTLEWHHFAEDVRYGLGSSGSQNAIHTVFKALGLELFTVYHPTGWDTADYMLNTRYPGGRFNYNLVSYIRVPKETPIS